jgi:glycosyltransferase involved in cell wall biosynthesis
MRVIVLNDYGFVNGGASQVAITSLNALAESGVDITFVSAVGPVDPVINKNLVKIINFGLHDLWSNPSKIQAAIFGIWNSCAAACFEKVLTNFEPHDTVIHLHKWENSLSSSVVQVAIKRGFKIVCTLHDYFSVCPNGGLYNYKKGRHCKLMPMSLACVTTNCDSRCYLHKLWRTVRHHTQKKFGHFQDGIKFFITVSKYSNSLIRPLLPPTAKLFPIDNPIDINKTVLADIAGNDAFTFIGQLSPVKGGSLFAAAARLAMVRPVFVGSGKDEKNIRVINHSSEFLGWQDRVGVIRAIRNSRAIVFPTLWHETQGLVVMEAAALGVPAIVSDDCAAKDAIVDGETGLLFRARNSNDLAAKLVLLQRNPQLAISLGKKAYDQYWRSPYTHEKHVKELINCYEEIIG